MPSLYNTRYAAVPSDALDDESQPLELTTVEDQATAFAWARAVSDREGRPYSVVKVVEVAYIADSYSRG